MKDLLSMMTLPFVNMDNQSVVGCAQNRVTDSAEEQRMPIRRDRKKGGGLGTISVKRGDPHHQQPHLQGSHLLP